MNTLQKKASLDYTILLKVICILAMIAFIGVQFLPYYQYQGITEESHRQHVLSAGKVPEVEETRVISMADMVWNTNDHDDLFGKWEPGSELGGGGLMNFHNEEFMQNDLTMMPFLCTLLILFGLIFFLWKKSSIWPCWFGVAAGAYATYTYIADPAGVYKYFSGVVQRPDIVTLLETIVQPKKFYIGGISYYPHLIAAIVLLVSSLLVVIPWTIKVVKWFTVKKRHY